MADDWGGFEEVQGSGATDEWAGFEDWSGFEEVGTEQPEDASSSDGTLDRSWADTGKDLGLSMLSGAIAIPKQVSGVADLLAAPARYAYEKITGEEARPLTAALADNGLDFQRAQGILGDMKSDASKQQREHVNVKFKEDGVLGGLGALYDNPIVAVESLSESIPGMLALGGATQVFALKIYQQAASSAAASGMGAEAAAAMGRAAVEQAVPKLGAISATLEGAQSAGDMAATSAAEGQLDMRQAGAAAGAGVSTALLGRWINDLGIKLGLEDVEAIVASRGMRDAAGDIFSGGVKGTIREGAEEVAQSGSEQVWGNVGDGKPLTEGVGQAIAEGGIVGGLLGMGGGALGGTRRRQSDGEPSLEALRRAEQEVLHQQELDRQAQDAADRAIEMGGDSLDAELAKQQVYVNGEASGMVPFEPEIASVVPEAKPDDPIVYNPYQQGMRPLEVDPAMELDNTIPFTRDEAPGLSLMDNADIGKPQAEPENTIEFTSPMDEKVASLEGRMEAYQQEKELASYNELPPTREPLPPVPEDDTAPAIPARQEAEAAEIQALEAQRDAIEKSVPGKEKGNQKHANPEMELQQAIAALGGLNRDEARQQGIDPEHFGLRSGGIARVFTSKGKTFDEMAEALSELGFFDGDKDGYSPNRLLDMLGNSLAGNEVYSPRSENAGARIAAQASMDQIEREIATLRSNYDDDQASPPTGPAYSALDDEEKGLAYTMMEAELAGMDPLAIDMLLDGDEPTAVIIEKLRRNIDNAKGQRQQAQPQGAPESGDQGHQAAPQRTGDQAQGRGEEAAPAEIGTTEEVGNATENVGNATVSPVADNQSVPAVRRGRDEKYDVDVEIRRDGGDYVLTEKDASGEREKRISSGAGGIYLGDSILNQDGEFVPPGQIVQAGSAGPESTPFKPEPSDRQAVIDLVAEIEFQRAQGNMDAVEELEARLQRIASGVESVKSPSADNQAEQQSPEADNAPATDLFGAAPKKEQSLADARREKDIQRNGREDVPADIDGGLFSNQSQQTDLSEQIKADEISTKVDQESPTADNAPDQQSPEGDIDAAAHAAATSPKNDLPEPTEAQIEAGNYKHGHVKVSGLDITIENPQGSTRSGKRPDGSTWSNVLGSHYGYLKRTEGADGEHVDVYVGPNPDSDQVFIVDQSDQKGGFDEHKVMLGYDSQAQAEAAYRENYDKGWELGPVTAMSVDQFKEWLATGDTSKPVAPEENALQKAKRKRDARRVERAAAEKPSDRTAQKPTSSPSNTDDVGGEMIANRRLFSGITLADLEGADNEALAVQMAQKSRVWKRPDYEALVKDGMNPLSAYLLKQVYDGIGNKPGGKGEKYRHDYVKAVNELRDAAEAFAGDKSIEAELIDLLKEAAKLQGANPFSNFKARAEINKRALALSDFIMDRVFPENASGKRWGRDNAEGNARVLSVGGNRFVKHAHFDMDTLGKAAKAIVAEGWPAKQEAWQKRFNVEQRDGKWIVKKKKQYRALATAETEAEAIEQAKSLATVEREEAFKEPKVALNRVVREGPDRRDGRDVSTEELRTTFGFQKINFGNWMKGPAHEAERQEHVNHIYDAMLDMAETLGIPPKAMSLNGMLSIAVGAQGRGGKAAAHFVAGVNEINITRESGAGSLAHEWAHAMDHYFAAQAGLAGKDDPFLSEYADNSYALKGSDIRPEIVSAYKTLLKNMKHVEKIRSPEEMQALREKQLESGREAANRYISRWRESIAKASEGKDGKLLESFDKEAAAILGGTPGEHVKMGKSKDYVRQSVDNMREIFKQAVGHYPSRDTANWLSGSAGTIELAADAAKFAETHKPQITERSEYYKGASGLEKNPQKPYWSTSWEMFARAFELYALDQYGKRADYMTARWKTMTEGPLSEHANKAYPREGEREDINKAFQALFDTIEARETDTGVGLFRSGEVSGTQSADVKKAIAGLRDGWKGGPKITVVQSQSDLPAHVRAEMRRQGLDTIAGYFDRTGQHVYLVADGIKDARDAQVTLLHEAVGHYGIESLLGREGINSFLREVHDARGRDPKIEAAYSYVDGAYDSASPIVKAAEVVAYIAEGDPKHGLVQRVIQMLRKALRRLGFSVPFSSRDIVEALSRAKDNLETGRKGHVGGAGGLFQSAYHGSPHRHNKFSTDYIGTGEGNQAYGWGLYFAQKRDIAEYYRDGLAEKPQYVLGRRLVEQFPGISAPALKEIAANYIVDGKSAERSIRLASYAFAKDREAIAAASPEIEKALQSAAKSSGALYAVEVPENDELLDWDAPISEKYMIELYDKMQQTHMYPFAKAFQDRWYKNQEGGRSQWDGQDFYVELSKEAGGDKAASLYLKSIGIPGLRYFDEQSRNQAPPVPEFTAWAGYFKGANLKTISDRDLADLRDEYQEFVDAEDNRTRNFVIFDDSRIDITDTLFRAGQEAHASREDLNRRMREEHHGIWYKAKQASKRYLTPGGLLPKAVFEAKIKRDSEMGATEMDVQYHVAALEHAFKRDYGKAFDKRTSAEEAMLRDALGGNPPEGLRQRTAVAIEAMRQYVDRLSARYVDVLRDDAMRLLDELEPERRQEVLAQINAGDMEGLNAKEAKIAQKAMLMQTIMGNVGEYVHRSYRAFDDPQWVRNVPSPVLNGARDYLEARYREQYPEASDQEAVSSADRVIEDILKNGTAFDNMEAFIRESKLGAKDLSLLKRRKVIAPEIRALMGEYTDPRLNFAKSATKMSRLIFNDLFLKKVREVGMGSFLFEEGTQPAGHWKPIAGESNESYAPLNGLMTTPEINQAFIDALGKEQMGAIFKKVVQLNGMVKFGKAQPLDATVYTPAGPAAMGDLEVGDYVCGINGRAMVSGIFPQGEMDVFRVTFSDGSSTEATGEHLWEIVGLEKRFNGVFQTKDIMRFPERSMAKGQIAVPVGVADFDARPVSVDPYLLGAILGDGSLRSSTLRFSTGDAEMVDMIRSLLPDGMKIERPASWADCDYSITAMTRSDSKRSGNPIMDAMKEYGVWGHLSNGKFIPDDYKYNSREVRLAVIQGLLDTDGWVLSADGQPEFYTSSSRLADDFVEVAESLGATALRREKATASGNTAYEIRLRVEDAREWFRLDRKKDAARKRIKPVKRTFKSIEFVGRKPCQCIMVDDPRHLYLTDRFIVTHNTVLSPTTAMRNFMSASFFTMAQGHFDMSHAWKSLKTHLNKEGENYDYLRKLKVLGVVYDTPYAEEMMRLLRDTDLADRLMNDRLKAKHALDMAQAFYRFGDDFWKVIGFENEVALQMKHRGLSRAEAEPIAAERIRNTYPTYSMVGKGVNMLRRFPLAGTFVSFPAEIIRNSYHIMRYAKEDWQHSKALGARRIAGIALVGALAYAAQEMSKDWLGVDDDEEEAVREQLPEWSKNSNLFFLSRKDGNLRYVDLSFLDPYNYWKRPITAIMRDEPLEDKIKSAASDMLSPFFGTDIVAGSLMEIWKNKKSSGGTVYNAADTPSEQVGAIATHLRRTLQPGAFANLERIIKAARGERSRGSGREYGMEDEMMALAGWRVSTLDPGVSLKYRGYDAKSELSNASAILSRAASDPNPLSEDDLRETFDRVTMIQEEVYTDLLKSIKAAKQSGLSTEAVQRQLLAANFSKGDAFALANGRIPKKAKTSAFMRNAVRSAADTYGKETQAEIARRRSLVIKWSREAAQQ